MGASERDETAMMDDGASPINDVSVRHGARLNLAKFAL